MHNPCIALYCPVLQNGTTSASSRDRDRDRDKERDRDKVYSVEEVDKIRAQYNQEIQEIKLDYQSRILAKDREWDKRVSRRCSLVCRCDYLLSLSVSIMISCVLAQ